MNVITCAGNSRKPRLLYIMTVGMFGGLRDLTVYLGTIGFDVSFIASPGPEMKSASDAGVSVYEVSIKREISPLDDLVSLWRLWRLLRIIRPDITNVGTPKAGLLGGLAAVIGGVQHRVYTMHGLRLETSRGWKRKLLWCTEWLSCRCAHQVYCVSQSLRERAIELKLVEPWKSSVVANGTFNGLEIDLYTPSPERKDKAQQLRTKLDIAPGALVVGYVGRMTRDKGVIELYQAFVQLCAEFTDVRLLLVGEYESGDPIPGALRARIDADSRVVRTGWISQPAAYYQVMDVLAMPTHREGFGLASIEAQASEVPVVSTSATGARDSFVEGVTGFSIPVGDAPALAEALALLLRDTELRRRMGKAGRDWVVRTFDRRIVWAEHRKRYLDVVQKQSS
jgi:glycosyltransferase involved in cell wall biosynthesis